MTTGPLESEVIARGGEDQLMGMGRKLDSIGTGSNKLSGELRDFNEKSGGSSN
jgi:hypothetical protein